MLLLRRESPSFDAKTAGGPTEWHSQWQGAIQLEIYVSEIELTNKWNSLCLASSAIVLALAVRILLLLSLSSRKSVGIPVPIAAHNSAWKLHQKCGPPKKPKNGSYSPCLASFVITMTPLSRTLELLSLSTFMNFGMMIPIALRNWPSSWNEFKLDWFQETLQLTVRGKFHNHIHTNNLDWQVFIHKQPGKPQDSIFNCSLQSSLKRRQ